MNFLQVFKGGGGAGPRGGRGSQLNKGKLNQRTADKFSDDNTSASPLARVSLFVMAPPRGRIAVAEAPPDDPRGVQLQIWEREGNTRRQVRGSRLAPSPRQCRAPLKRLPRVAPCPRPESAARARAWGSRDGGCPISFWQSDYGTLVDPAAVHRAAPQGASPRPPLPPSPPLSTTGTATGFASLRRMTTASAGTPAEGEGPGGGGGG